jgi:hypothetical protein
MNNVFTQMNEQLAKINMGIGVETPTTTPDCVETGKCYKVHVYGGGVLSLCSQKMAFPKMRDFFALETVVGRRSTASKTPTEEHTVRWCVTTKCEGLATNRNRTESWSKHGE